MQNHLKLFCLIVGCSFSLPGWAQLYFTENKGQWDDNVLSRTMAGNSAFYLMQEGYTVVMHHPEDYRAIFEYMHGHTADGRPADKRQAQPALLRSHAYKVKFANSNPQPQVIFEKPMEGYENFFLGNDPSRWATHCRQYQAVTYKNVYPNVDVRYYVANDRLKYDIVVHPGADMSRIKLQYEGVEKLSIQNNELVIGTSVGVARELSPYSYQFVNGRRATVSCRYRVNGNEVSFDAKQYDRGSTLIIDPSLIFFSYSRSTADNWGFTATYGPDGSFYGGGIVFGTGFPVSTGAFQTTYGGGSTYDIGIIRLSPNGRNRIFATYIGGNDSDQPHSLICDAQGNVVLAGRSRSANYPVTAASVGSTGGWDIIVTKLRADGTQLIGSMRIGGTGDDGVNITDNRQAGAQSILRNYGDDGRSEVILDDNENILVASCSRSGNFPVINGFQTANAGLQDGVILKLNSNANVLIWSTLLGGAGNDAAFVLSINPITKNIYVAGGTASTNFPLTAGSMQPNYNMGEADGYVSILRDNGGSVTHVRSTYLGTGGVDIVYGIQFDQSGFPYVMGTTMGAWPVINARYVNANARQFIAKLRPDLSGFVYSTTFGTSGAAAPNISPVAFLVDRCENVYVSGWGGEINSRDGFPSAGTSNMPRTADALQQTTDGSDFYFFVLKKNADTILYGSYFGQNGPLGDHVDGGTSRFDPNGVIYQAMCANCTRAVNFPGTPGVWGQTNPATSNGQCNLGMVKISFDLAGIDVALQAVGARQLNFCLPATVEFTDTVRKAKQYIWVWNDGSPNDTTLTNTFRHTFTRAGVFDVKVIGIDTNSCNVKDSAFLRIRVTTDSARIGFTAQRRPPCTSLTFDFTNTSDPLSSSQNFGPRSFVWVWGDGTPNDTSFNATHTFPGPGTYNVRLILIDPNFCNVGDSTAVINFQVQSTITAGFTVPNGCAPYRPQITDRSVGASSYLWVASDGQTSTSPTPNFVFNNPGTYTIRQYIYNDNSCNLVDSALQTFTVIAPPRAGFTFSPNPSQENTPTRFTSTASADVVRWLWLFGDGDSSNLRDPVHQYVSEGTFDACQIVFNAAGCVDTLCQPVQSLISISNDIPSAFTPNGDGINDVLYVRGFGITKMTLRIYNRQGLKIFESTSPNVGWDGTYKGVPQPMDTYAYTLDIEYFNGERVRRKGDVTLIR